MQPSGASQSIELITRIKRTQRRATKYILKLPFSCTISYMDRLKTLDLLSLTFWHEYPDMVFFLQNHSWSRIGRAINMWWGGDGLARRFWLRNQTQTLISIWISAAVLISVIVYSPTFKTIRYYFIFPKKCKSVLYFLRRILSGGRGGEGDLLKLQNKNG